MPYKKNLSQRPITQQMPPNSSPKISIVTPTFNQEKYLEETIDSVLSQRYPNLEYIIIDGGSTDRTPEIIAKYSRHLSYWVSQKDKGQADAIRKGLRHCQGNIFNWINGDDTLAEGALHAIGEIYIPDEPHLISGSVLNFGEYEQLLIENRNLALYFFLLNRYFSYHQPGVWLANIGNERIARAIDPELQYVFDHYMMINLLADTIPVRATGRILAQFRLHADSKTMAAEIGFHEEHLDVFLRNAKDVRFASYRDEILVSYQYFKKKWGWKDELMRIRQWNVAKRTKLTRIISHCVRDPKTYLNRTSLGAAKIIFFGK